MGLSAARQIDKEARARDAAFDFLAPALSSLDLGSSRLVLQVIHCAGVQTTCQQPIHAQLQILVREWHGDHAVVVEQALPHNRWRVPGGQ